MPSTVRAFLRSVRWALLALTLVMLVGWIVAPGFLDVSWRDARCYGVPIDILNHGSRVAIVAMGMALVISLGGVDLSVGAVAAIAGAVGAVLAAGHGVPGWLAVAAAVATGGVCGAWNGSLVAFLRLQPFIATLVLMVGGRGVAQLVAGGVTIPFDDPLLVALGNASWLGLPTGVWLLAGVLGTLALATHATPAGQLIVAAGESRAAASISGVPHRALTLGVYAFAGAAAGIVGLVESSYIRAADANNTGTLLELDAILAVVLGGASLRGGKFSLAATVLGALVIQAITKLLYMLDVPPDIAPAPKALVVLGVCLAQSPTLRAALRRRAAA